MADERTDEGPILLRARTEPGEVYDSTQLHIHNIFESLLKRVEALEKGAFAQVYGPDEYYYGGALAEYRKQFGDTRTMIEELKVMARRPY